MSKEDYVAAFLSFVMASVIIGIGYWISEVNESNNERIMQFADNCLKSGGISETTLKGNEVSARCVMTKKTGVEGVTYD